MGVDRLCGGEAQWFGGCEVIMLKCLVIVLILLLIFVIVTSKVISEQGG